MGPYSNCILLDPRSPQYYFTHVVFEAQPEGKKFPHVHITHMLNKSISVAALVHGLGHCWGRKLRLLSPASHHHNPLQDLHSYAPIKYIYNQACCASSPSYAELTEKHIFLSTSDPVLPGLVLNCWQSNPSYRSISHIPGAWWAC